MKLIEELDATAEAAIDEAKAMIDGSRLGVG
jgi:hypothetical protein